MTKNQHSRQEPTQKGAAPRRTNGAMTFLRLAALILLVLFTYAMGTIPANERNAIGSTFAPLFFVVAPILYFLPTIEAGLRQHRSLTSIGLVNLFLGWTLLGWVAAIAWACAGTSRPTDKPVMVRPSEPTLASLSEHPASVADELRKLVKLRDDGHLTPQEFELQKARLLG